ncbi:MAG: glycine betaine/L-proline ABC transporter substrate-binding protein ProX [Cyanobacteria bacterium P01_G01_bin.54]
MFKKLRFFILAVTLFVSLGACQSPESTAEKRKAINPASPGEGTTVRASNSDWIEEQFLTEIINIGLEDLGYTLEEIRQADYAALNVSIANGDLDYTVGFYRPGHDAFFENAGGEEKLEILGQVVLGGGIQGILIDKETAEAYAINNLRQLQDPEIAKLFDSDGDGKANLVGCQVGWKCGEIIDHQIEAFNLGDTVEHIQGAYSALIADVLARHSQNEPVLYYAYNPHWLLSTLKPGEDATWLEVPFTTLPEDFSSLSEVDTTVDGKNLGFPIIVQHVLANQTFIDENPVARRWFEVVEIPVADVNAESILIKDGEDSPEEIRRHAEAWIENNQSLFDSWLKAAVEPAD